MPVSDELAIFLAQYLIWMTALAVPYLWFKRERHDLLRIAVSVIFAFAVAEIIKTLTAVPRPFVAGGFEPLIAVSPRDFYGSFPSGHATLAAALAAAIFFTEKIPGLFILLIGILVGWGRVLVGVHFPLDILAGLVLGTAVSASFKVIHDRFPVW